MIASYEWVTSISIRLNGDLVGMISIVLILSERGITFANYVRIINDMSVRANFSVLRLL